MFCDDLYIEILARAGVLPTGFERSALCVFQIYLITHSNKLRGTKI
jgi:hypothetical protein